MATKYQMQALSSADGVLYSWLRTAPDWTGALFPGPGTPLDIAIACSPMVSPAGQVYATITASIPMLGASVAMVVGGIALRGLPEYIGYLTPDFLGVSRKQFGQHILG